MKTPKGCAKLLYDEQIAIALSSAHQGRAENRDLSHQHLLGRDGRSSTTMDSNWHEEMSDKALRKGSGRSEMEQNKVKANAVRHARTILMSWELVSTLVFDLGSVEACLATRQMQKPT